MGAFAWDRRTGMMTNVLFAGDASQHNAVYAAPLNDPDRYDEATVTTKPGWWPGDPLVIAVGPNPDPGWGLVHRDPTKPDAWGPINYAYHGSTQGVPFTSSPSATAFQPVGAAPGPTPNVILLSADNEDGPGIARLDIEESPPDGDAHFSVDHLQLGNSAYTVNKSGYLSFFLATTTPEHPTEYTATITQNNTSTTFQVPHTLYGVVQPDGKVIWGKCASINKSTAHAFGRTIYHSTEDSEGFIRLGLSEPIVGRPERIGAGGPNLMPYGMADTLNPIAQYPNTVEQLTPEQLDELPPRPFLGPVYHLKRENAVGSETMLKRLDLIREERVLPQGAISGRVWVLSGQHGLGNPLRIDLSAIGHESIHFGSVGVYQTGRWKPLDIYGSFNTDEAIKPYLQVFTREVARDERSIHMDFYLGIDSFTPGWKSMGYPYPQVRGAGVAPLPAESRTVTGLGTSSEGSLAVAGMMPWDGVDYGWRMRGLRGALPLLTLYSDEDSWVSVQWTDLGRVEVAVSIDGAISLAPVEIVDKPIQRGDPFQIFFRWDPQHLTIDTSWGQCSKSSVSIARPPVPDGSTELRFGGHEADPGAMTGIPLDVFGVGRWNRRLTDQDVATQMHEMDYLRTASCLADMTSDGHVDIDDVLAFLDRFAGHSAASDFALPEGVMNIDDVIGFLNAYASGCQGE